MAQPLIFEGVQAALRRKAQKDQLAQQADESDQNRAVQVLQMGQQAAMEPQRQASLMDRIKEQAAGAALREQIRGQYDVSQESTRGDWQVAKGQTAADAQRDVVGQRVNAERYRADSAYRQAIDKEQMGIDAGKYEKRDPMDIAQAWMRFRETHPSQYTPRDSGPQRQYDTPDMAQWRDLQEQYAKASQDYKVSYGSKNRMEQEKAARAMRILRSQAKALASRMHGDAGAALDHLDEAFPMTP